MGFAQVDNRGMEPIRRRPAAVVLGVAALAACLAMPARATPGTPGPTTLAGARAGGADPGGPPAPGDLERSELALQATQAEYASDVRDLYARGPLAPLELLLAAGDIHELALATGAAGVVLGRDLQALSRVGLATGTVRALVRAEQARHVRRPGPDGARPHTGALVRVDAMRPTGYAGATRPRSG
jgi:hypothetical protein